MANNCVTKFILAASAATPLKALADILNSLKVKYPADPNYYWGQQALKHLYDELPVKTDFPELRGYVDSDPWLGACLFMSGRHVSSEPFTVQELTPGRFTLRFSMVSGWATPDWFILYLEGLCEKHADEGLAYGYLATDEFNSFHTVHNGQLTGCVYDIDHYDGDCYNYGQEEQFLDNICRIIKVSPSQKMRRDAAKRNFTDILAAVEQYNEANEDEQVYVHIYIEV